MSMNGKGDGKAGRPTKCTKKVCEDYTAARAIGLSHEAAAASAGVSFSVARNWREWGQEELDRRESGEEADLEKTPFVQFVKGIREADAEAATRWQMTINTAANVSPQWAAYMLERRYPREYRTVSMQEISSRDGKPLCNGGASVVMVTLPDNGCGDRDPRVVG